MPTKKKRRFEDKDHVNFVRTQKCCICQAGFYTAHPIVQAHHLLKPWIGARGMSLRADDRNCIPLCLHHHAKLHTKYGSEAAFFKAYGLSEDYGKKLAQSLWEKHSVHGYGVSNLEDDDLPF